MYKLLKRSRSVVIEPAVTPEFIEMADKWAKEKVEHKATKTALKIAESALYEIKTMSLSKRAQVVVDSALDGIKFWRS